MVVFGARYLFAAPVVACLVVGAATPVAAETLFQALGKAYSSNPDLNAARASTRATDENVPLAKSGGRPTVSAGADIGAQSTDTKTTAGVNTSTTTTPGGVDLTISQPLFRGFRTKNATKAAEAGVHASREALRNTEQNVLLNAVTAYADVLRDGAIAGLRARNVEFLNEQVRAASDRFSVGEGTRTDVAQADARRSGAISDLSAARAAVNTSRAIYRQVIGDDPRQLAPAKTAEHLLPHTLDSALSAGLTDHPSIRSTLHAVDAAAFDVKEIEGELLPTVTLEGSLSRRYEPSSTVRTTDTASIIGRLTVPIYQGGGVSARVRQAKETLGQRRIEVDVAREQVRAAVVAGWGGLQSAIAQIEAAQASVDAAQLALEGVIEEQRVGQRTTLDVLDAQAELLNARITLVSAQRDRVVASYTLLAAVGKLSASQLGLQVSVYRPEHHYKKVRDKWFGLRTPDGR
ncbi:MAG: TolC family outer membrane protein [Hyphomicrobiales bacterium]|nr:TolC family outer membrane protein [Hyphomicrobiales bacterium]